MSDGQIAKYEAWAARLEENIRSLARQRRSFHRIFFGFVVLSAIGFFFGAWLGVGMFATGVMVCISGLCDFYDATLGVRARRAGFRRAKRSAHLKAG